MRTVRNRTFGGVRINNDNRNKIHHINYLTSEMESLYHQASLKLGITDSVSIVLYTIFDEVLSGSSWGQSDAYHLTINTSDWNIKDIAPAVAELANCWFGRR